MIQENLQLALASSLVCIITMFFTWLYAIRIDNFSIVDIVWSFNFPLIAIVLFGLADGFWLRKFILLVIVVIWGTRLGTHLLIRIRKHIQQEDGRYLTLRKKWATNLNGQFLTFYMMQAASNVFLAIPFILIANNANETITTIEIAGISLWLVAIIGEWTSDKQLSNFKKNPNNKGLVCNVGLWSWSRHPNYFFEFLIWVSYAVFAWPCQYGWIAVLAPLFILYLLLKVTGIPMNEEQSINSKGQAYIDYQKTTSKFIPLPPKNTY